MHFDLKNNLSILTMAGSHAYGMSTPESDIDIRGICVAPMKVRCGIYQSFEQTEDAAFLDDSLLNIIEKKANREIPKDEKIDSTVYDIHKAIKLIADCNPNMLEIVFADESDIVFLSPIGQKIIENKQMFLSLKAKHTYVGYASAQLKRIVRHRAYLLGEVPKKPNRKDYGLPEHESLISKDQRDIINEGIVNKIRSWGIGDIEMEASNRITLTEHMRDFQCSVLLCNDLDLDNTLEDIAASSLGISDSVRKILNAERSYRNALRDYNSYIRWEQERNPKRKELEAKYKFDTKHASHLIRLARTGVELLKTGTIKVKRDDAQELLDIRRGSRTFEDIKEESEILFRQMDSLYKENPKNIPKKIQTDRIQDLYFEIIGLS